MTILNLGSPYWLRINGAWIHLEGVAPGVQRSVDRPGSSFVTVGGVRHAQQAPRAPRSWSWSLPWATAEGLRLLAIAAESDDVWLADTVASQSNMLAPWETQGRAGVALVADGVPLRPLATGATAQAQVRAGVPVTVSCWSALAGTGATIATVAHPGGTAPLVTAAGAGIRRSATLALTPATSGPLTITPTAGALAAGVTALQATEGVAAPARWLPGQRSPCRVRVLDAEHTLSLIRSGIGYGAATVTLEEVG